MKYKLSLDSDTFSDMKSKFNEALTGIIKNMQDKEASDGSITLKMNISLSKQFPFDDDGNMQEVYKPSFMHEISSEIKLKTEKVKGELARDAELYWDSQLSCFAMRDIEDGPMLDMEG